MQLLKTASRRAQDILMVISKKDREAPKWPQVRIRINLYRIQRDLIHFPFTGGHAASGNRRGDPQSSYPSTYRNIGISNEGDSDRGKKSSRKGQNEGFYNTLLVTAKETQFYDFSNSSQREATIQTR